MVNLHWICFNKTARYAPLVILLILAGCTVVRIQGDNNNIEVRDRRTEANPIDTDIDIKKAPD